MDKSKESEKLKIGVVYTDWNTDKTFSVNIFTLDGKKEVGLFESKTRLENRFGIFDSSSPFELRIGDLVVCSYDEDNPREFTILRDFPINKDTINEVAEICDFYETMRSDYSKCRHDWHPHTARPASIVARIRMKAGKELWYDEERIKKAETKVRERKYSKKKDEFEAGISEDPVMDRIINDFLQS